MKIKTEKILKYAGMSAIGVAIWFLIIMGPSAVFSFLGVGYDNEKELPKIATKITNQQQKQMTEFFMDDGEETFIKLLAIKYDMRADDAQSIINIFTPRLSLKIIKDNTVDSINAFMTSIEEFKRLPIEDRIKKLSSEKGIKENDIAALLVDYKLWVRLDPNSFIDLNTDQVIDNKDR